jgi:orotidine-5'-phosphate decarboxylase
LNFADRLSAAVAERGSQIALGLDPDPMRLLPAAAEAAGEGPAAEQAARAVSAHCRLLIDAVASACVAVKLQLACFERLGAPGWGALAESVEVAREAGLLVIADGKRGDVPHTALAYGQSLVGETPTPWGNVQGLGADAVTANPLLGRDALEPIVSAARRAGAGTFILVRTSNKGAAEIQDADENGGPLHSKLARLVDDLGAEGVGECGLADTGAVVAATRPELIAVLRQQMPRAVFLLPGVGAQGGEVQALRPAFAPGRAAGLVAVSRSIADAALAAGDPAAGRAAAEKLREAAWDLAAP